MNIFAIRDAALGEYMNPFVAPSSGLALRSFTDEVNRADSPLHAHPDDYELFQLGEFDPETGRITSFPAPKSLSRARDVFVSASDTQLRLAK